METNTTTAGATFKVGETYSTVRATDHTMSVTATIIKRTAKFVTIEDKWGKTSRVGVKTHRGQETIYPEGVYSMCPVIFADDRVTV